REQAQREQQHSGAFMLLIDLGALTDGMVNSNRPHTLSLAIGAATHTRIVGADDHGIFPGHEAQRQIQIGPKTLRIHMKSQPTAADLPLLTAGALSLITALVFATMARVVRARRLAEGKANQATGDLQQSRIQYQDLFEGSIQGIMIHRNERVLFVNQSFVDMFGFRSRDEVLGQGSLEAILGAKRVASLRENAATMQANTTHSLQVEYETARKDGTAIVVVDSLRMVNWQGTPAVQSTLMNITERNAAERALVHETEKALAAARAKSEFLANMSHELRTPMNGVLGMLELLQDTGLGDEQTEFVEIARSSGDALLGLINDVLDLSKLEAGALTLNSDEFYVTRLFETVIERLATTAHGKGVELVFEREIDVPAWLFGDPQRLQQIITNLLGNAIKFTSEGNVVLRAERTLIEGDACHLRVSVTDSGIGIPKHRLASIFDVFTQADSSTTRKYGGTGLGLAISRQLVEQMGGSIGVDSTLGHGSEFWFVVPLKLSAQGPKALPGSGQEPLTILVADSCERSAKALVAQLALRGTKAKSVSTTSALDACLANISIPIDTAFVDDWWPGGALKLRERLLAHPNSKTARLVLLQHLTPAREPITNDLFARRLSKPVTETRLVECLGDLHSPAPVRTNVVRPQVARAPLQGDRTILVVEDNIVNQRVVASMLKAMGFASVVVSDGEQAIAALEQTTFDVVLMDCQMPVLDGYGATRRIREIEANADAAAPGTHRRIPIVALTANAMEGDEAKCMHAGMDDYLSKPLRAEQLRSTIVRWLPANAA
ncbi:MAG: two-component system sensor histidine kinase/response regulator, partial [Gammaproteobacteria bacterium]